MEITKQVALYLDEMGLGRFDESGMTGNIFINSIPDTPAVAIAIFSTGGPGADPRNIYTRAAVQVLIRTVKNDPRAGEVTAQKTIDVLNGFSSDFLVDGVGNYIIDVQAVQAGPSQVGKDQVGRFEYSQNFIIEYLK